MTHSPWNDWESSPPEAGSCIEGEFINAHGELEHTTLNLYHYVDERGALWGHSTGDWRAGTHKVHHPRYFRWRYVGPPTPPKEQQGKAMLIWEFYDAPGELRSLSNHGGDEDWLALLPEGMTQPSWMESGGSFGCCSVSEHPLADGRTVYIGAHA